MNHLKNFGAGAVVGVANIIPGVSGGTMAVVLGVYDRLLEAMGLKNLRKNIPFILFFGLGVGAGILAFSRAIQFLLGNYPMATNFTFLGLILGSVPMIWKTAVKTTGSFKPTSLLALGGAMLGMMLLNSVQGGQSQVLTSLNLTTALWLGVVAAISAFAMILPGVSGSFVMLLLGAYPTVLAAIARLDIVMLIPVGMGVLVGLLAGSRLVSWLLERFPQPAYFAILGLILGSLPGIYPGFTAGTEGFIALGLMAAATGMTYWFSTMERG